MYYFIIMGKIFILKFHKDSQVLSLLSVPRSLLNYYLYSKDIEFDAHLKNHYTILITTIVL